MNKILGIIIVAIVVVGGIYLMTRAPKTSDPQEQSQNTTAEANVKAGTYDQVRLVVDSVAIKTKAGETKVAKLPSGELKINTVLVVNANTTSSINFDFLADKSLHTASDGNYIFAPVVKTETKSNASVSVNASNVVTITGGRIDNTNTVGMDIDGSIEVNFQIDSKQKLDLDASGVIKLNGLLN